MCNSQKREILVFLTLLKMEVVRESDLAILVATTELVFLAKLYARTSQPEVPAIQIYYVKYLAKSLVWPGRFHEPPVVTGGKYERVY
jgi:hypothetical protein